MTNFLAGNVIFVVFASISDFCKMQFVTIKNPWVLNVQVYILN